MDPPLFSIITSYKPDRFQKGFLHKYSVERHHGVRVRINTTKTHFFVEYWDIPSCPKSPLWLHFHRNSHFHLPKPEFSYGWKEKHMRKHHFSRYLICVNMASVKHKVKRQCLAHSWHRHSMFTSIIFNHVSFLSLPQFV